MPDTPDTPPPLSMDDVRKVARLARLELDDADDAHRRLTALLAYVERLRAMDLSGVEPLTHVGEGVNVLRDDEPGPTLSPRQVADLAPAHDGPFIRVPKVIGEGGGA